MRRAVLLLTLLAACSPVARAADTPDAVAARMQTHAENVGLRTTSKPIVTATGATCRAGGSLGKIQQLFFEIADTERGLDVTSVSLTRADAALLAKSVLVEVEYTVAIAPTTDEAATKRRWAVPVLLNGLLGGTVAATTLTIFSGKIANGTMTVDARTSNPDGSKAVAKQLDAGPGKLVTEAKVDERKVTEMVQNPAPGVPQKKVVSYAFTLTATYDPAPVRLDVLKARAYN